MFGNSSIVVFLAMFGGSTLILFLLCYCCQRKLKPQSVTSDNPQQITINHTQDELINSEYDNRANLIESSVLPPPPPYEIAVKSNPDQNPPDYNEAISPLSTSDYI